MLADADADAKIAAWKAAHIASVVAKHDVEAARARVREVFDANGVRFIESSSGTVALQPRAGATKVDWESLARALVPANKLAKELPKHTTTGAATNVLAAPREWGVEAG
jgi:hypothetical protein